MEEGSESVRRITNRPSRGLYVVVVLLIGLVGALFAVDLAGEDGEDADVPRPGPTTTTTPQASPPVSHPPLEGPTGLELLVGGTLIDVDRDQRTWVGGLEDRPEGEAAGMGSFQIGDHSVIVRYFSCDGCGPVEVRVLVLRRGETRPEQILADDRIDVAPGLDGIWIVRRGVDRCTASEMSLDGVAAGDPREIDCGWVLRGETPLGLLADSRTDPGGVPIPTTYLLDPVDLSVRYQAHRILAVAGDRMLVRDAGEDGYGLRSIDGDERPLPDPDSIGDPARGTVSPDGRYVVLDDPAGGPDLLVADVVERRWLRLSLGVATRLLSHDWADDGRLVVFGPLIDGLGDRDLALATWSPGDDQAAARPVDYPPGVLLVRSSR